VFGGLAILKILVHDYRLPIIGFKAFGHGAIRNQDGAQKRGYGLHVNRTAIITGKLDALAISLTAKIVFNAIVFTFVV